LPVGATPPQSLYKTPSPLLNILGVQKLLLYTTHYRCNYGANWSFVPMY
jgi:hypothetical protein